MVEGKLIMDLEGVFIFTFKLSRWDFFKYFFLFLANFTLSKQTTIKYLWNIFCWNNLKNFSTGWWGHWTTFCAICSAQVQLNVYIFLLPFIRQVDLFECTLEWPFTVDYDHFILYMYVRAKIVHYRYV